MDNKNANRSILFIAISIAVVVITGTFAWLSWRSQNTAMVLTIGDIKGLSVSLKPYQIDAKLSPVSSYTSSTNVVKVDVTAANAKSEADDFKLYYKIDEIDDELIDSGFKYTIAKCTSSCSNQNNYTVLNNAGGDFSSASSNSNLEIYQEEIPANATYNYKVYLWIDSSSGNQSNMQNKTFEGELRAKISETLYTMMRDNAVMDNIKSDFVTSNNGINFGAVSSNTNGKGIYIRAGTEHNDYPIYYYRGAVTDNNVLFASKCWKIVRTTDTGGVKLLYNGVPTNGNCNNTGENSSLSGTSKFNSGNNYIGNVGYKTGTNYIYQKMTMTGIGDTYMYGTDYDETNHRLVTTNAMNFAGTSWGTYYNQLNNNHYTCFNASGECNQVNYIFYTNNETAYYVTIPSGKTVDIMLAEAITATSNSNNSTIKAAIDTWYASNDSNMTSYTSYLEDTIWCNDRSIYQLNGWNPNGGNITKDLYFSAYGRLMVSPYTPGFECNINDAFTLTGNSRGNGKLIYPVGLLTADEAVMAGGNTSNGNMSYYLYTGITQATMSPYGYLKGYSAEIFQINGDVGSGKYGLITTKWVNNTFGIRPVISLKAGTKFSGGTGIATDPYIVE